MRDSQHFEAEPPQGVRFLFPENAIEDEGLDVGGGDGIALQEAGLGGDEEGALGGIVGDAAVGGADE